MTVKTTGLARAAKGKDLSLPSEDKPYTGKHRDPRSRRRKPGEAGKPVIYTDLNGAAQQAKKGKPPKKP
jgi:hypothetical protein